MAKTWRKLVNPSLFLFPVEALVRCRCPLDLLSHYD